MLEFVLFKKYRKPKCKWNGFELKNYFVSTHHIQCYNLLSKILFWNTLLQRSQEEKNVGYWQRRDLNPCLAVIAWWNAFFVCFVYSTSSLPPLDWPLPTHFGQCELKIEVQPKTHHRAHYETEGSRGAVKASTGGHPVVKVWVGTYFGDIIHFLMIKSVHLGTAEHKKKIQSLKLLLRFYVFVHMALLHWGYFFFWVETYSFACGLTLQLRGKIVVVKQLFFLIKKKPQITKNNCIINIIHARLKSK